MSRSVVVGDIHGCLDEFKELVRRVELTVKDRLVLAGDLVDRGPDSAGVIRYARELGAECVLGNHDEKHVRWDLWESRVKSGHARSNPMKFSDAKLAVHDALSREDLEWLASLPRYIYLDFKTVIVHGGVLPGVPIPKQPKTLINLRYVDNNTGKAVSIRGGMGRPNNSTYWSEIWSGPETVFYGHAVHSLATPRVDHHDGYACWGLDTGCVFGGRLTAAVIHKDRGVELVQVPAKRVYASLLSCNSHSSENSRELKDSQEETFSGR